jgi:hypothetical protein
MAYIRIQNAVGKVFAGSAAAGSSDLFLKWADGDFSIIGIDDEDPSDLYIVNVGISLDAHGQSAVNAGLITEQQLNNMIAQKEAAEAAEAEASRYAKYLRLKAIYDPE